MRESQMTTYQIMSFHCGPMGLSQKVVPELSRTLIKCALGECSTCSETQRATPSLLLYKLSSDPKATNISKFLFPELSYHQRGKEILPSPLAWQSPLSRPWILGDYLLPGSHCLHQDHFLILQLKSSTSAVQKLVLKPCTSSITSNTNVHFTLLFSLEY